jgi:hypothetical protein
VNANPLFESERYEPPAICAVTYKAVLRAAEFTVAGCVVQDVRESFEIGVDVVEIVDCPPHAGSSVPRI